jgi:hypothetical protein
MNRVDTPTAVAALPAQNAAGTPGYFTQGNPALGLAATVPGQDWFNAIQEELLAIIIAGGMTPEKAVTNQVLLAIQQLIQSLEFPIGGELLWPTETPPDRFLCEDGSSLIRTTYPALFTKIGTRYGAADAAHFNLPNPPGRFIRIWANGQAIDPDRTSRTAPMATGATIAAGDHVGTEQTDALKLHKHNMSDYLPVGWGYSASSNNVLGQFPGTPFDTSSTGGTETRPINTNRMMIIKAY